MSEIFLSVARGLPVRRFAGPAVLLLCCLAAAPATAAEPWLSIDTDRLVLSVMRGEVAVLELDNIAIGSNGARADKRLGDEITPTGEFTITEVRDSVRFRHFIELSYPTVDHARRALALGYIQPADFAAVQAAQASGAAPPQDTPLGGHIGIHGIGAGDSEVHALFNWTNGCIALTNEQLARLLPWVSAGTRVVIH